MSQTKKNISPIFGVCFLNLSGLNPDRLMKPGLVYPKIWGVAHAIFWGSGSGSGSVIKCVSFLMFPWLFDSSIGKPFETQLPQVSGASSPMAFHGICRGMLSASAFGRFRPADPSCVGTLARDRGSSWRHASVLLASTMAVFGPEKKLPSLHP